jgi:putative ABC transport system permease protein
MGRLFEDARHGVRLLWKTPSFTLVAVAALALGIGANSAVFSVVDAVLLRPLPFRDPGRLVVLWEKNPARNRYRMFVSPADFLEWRAQARSFDGMAAVESARMNLTGGPNGHIDPEEIAVERVSAALFPTLGVGPVIGRAFLAEEDQPGRGNVVLLSHRLWQRRFGADQSIAGKSIRLRDQAYTVTGVLPAGFALVNAGVEAWLPIGLAPGDPRGATTRNLMVIARLRMGTDAARARTEMEGIGARLEKANPKTNAGWRPSLFDLGEEMVGSVRTAMLVLLAAVALLLVIACANVANLLLARAASRSREIAIRTALGATRARLIAQLLTESVLLGLAGGAAGLFLAWSGIRALLVLAPAGIPRLAGASVDVRLLAFTFAVSLATGVIFGAAPALQASRTDLHEPLKEGGRGGTSGRAAGRLRSGLVVAEMAIAVVVLIGAGLLLRSFLRLRAANPGFQPSNLLTLRVPLAGGRNAAQPRRIAFFAEVVERCAALPGVRSAGAVASLPLTGLGVGSTFAIDGRPAPPPEERPIGLVRSATPRYLATLGIPLRAGRDFGVFDGKDAPPVAIVNDTLARRFWPGANPLGGRVVIDNLGRTAEVVGVAGDVKPDRLENDDWPTIYLPYAQAPAASMSLVLRTAGDPMAAAGPAIREVRRLDPDQPVADIRSMDQVLDGSVAGARFNTLLLAIFAGVAFLLATVGIYGVIAYNVTERTHEFGIRLALGASGGDLVRLVVKYAARLAGAGIAVGVAAALALTRLMASLLYTVTPTDPATFAAIVLMLGAIALLAAYVPSRRAAALDPAGALRHE